MDLQTRKLNFIQEFLRLANDRITDKFEKMLQLERKKIVEDEISPMALAQYEQRIDNAIDGASLMVEFRIQPDLKFDRKQHDLVCNHPISVLDLITGTTFEFTVMVTVFEVAVSGLAQDKLEVITQVTVFPFANVPFV